MMDSVAFPASYSTLCPEALASLISSKYGIGAVQVQFLVRGVGDTYRVDSRTGPYVLRVYRSATRTFVQIQAEMEMLTALNQADVPVSFPIPDLTGRYVHAVSALEGLRHLVLFSYAPGHSVSILTDAQLHDVGFQMARFHSVSSVISLSDDRWRFDVETTLFNPLKLVKWAFSELPEEYAWLMAASEAVAYRLMQWNAVTFPTGFCHFDLLSKNFHFQGNKVTFFDFDFLGHGWLANDIMVFWMQLQMDAHFGRMSQAAANRSYTQFLTGYQKIRLLSDEELAVVPYLGLGWWVFYLGFYTTHDQFFPLLEQANLKIRIGVMRQLLEKHWKIG